MQTLMELKYLNIYPNLATMIWSNRQSKQYYTYIYLRKDGSPYYVGKGKNERAYTTHTNHFPPKERIRLLIQYCQDEQDAFDKERKYISIFKRRTDGGMLNNLTLGGEGASGLPTSILQKEKASELGKIQGRKNIENGLLQKYWSFEHLSRMGVKGGSRTSEKKAQHSRAIATLGGQAAKKSGQASTIAHIRWHINKNIIKENCKHCNKTIEDVKQKERELWS